MYARKDYLKDIKRIVIKVGTSTLAYPGGHMNIKMMDSLVKQIADLQNRGLQVLLVTSGAIGAGLGKLGFDKKPDTIPEKQAAAAVGQGLLLHMYEKLFSEYGITVAQILLTGDDLSHRKRFLNARNVLFALLERNIVPIINENDTVAVDEIKVGDNDTLSALVSSVVEADLLILLSDIDGLYDSNPRVNKDAKLIRVVEEVNEDIESMAGGAGTAFGTGGMETKIKAAKIAVSSGTAMVIARGDVKGIIYDIIDGLEVGTWFCPRVRPMHARKRWIAYSRGVKGKITIDVGAVKALTEGGKSLLPGGIKYVEGDFHEGDEVCILSESGEEIARGLANYNAREIEAIKGLKSTDIEEKLGYRNYDEVIHRDNMVILK